MILVDTSVWIDHFRNGSALLQSMLERGDVLMHALVIGELACGNLNRRTEILMLLRQLPASVTATDMEVLNFIDRHALMGIGLGYIDVHLMASSLLSGNTELWTLDKHLVNASSELGIGYSP